MHAFNDETIKEFRLKQLFLSSQRIFLFLLPQKGCTRINIRMPLTSCVCERTRHIQIFKKIRGLGYVTRALVLA